LKPRELTFVKLGGSLLTDKRRAGSFCADVAGRLAGELEEAARSSPGGLVLGHGSGSFGHATADEHRIHPGEIRPEQLPGVVATQQAAAALHRLVLKALREQGALPFSLAPSSFLVAAGGEPVELSLEPLERALALGLLPVVYGDVVMDRDWGASICSTEKVFLALSKGLERRGFDVAQAIWMGKTDGIYDQDGKTIPVVTPETFEEVATVVGGADGADVTGGMRHRLESAVELARAGIHSWIVNGQSPGLLARLLRGEEVPGTRVLPA
jgi:isopentenyl phosphate kinase